VYLITFSNTLQNVIMHSINPSSWCGFWDSGISLLSSMRNEMELSPWCSVIGAKGWRYAKCRLQTAQFAAVPTAAHELHARVCNTNGASGKGSWCPPRWDKLLLRVCHPYYICTDGEAECSHTWSACDTSTSNRTAQWHQEAVLWIHAKSRLCHGNDHTP